ncbi:hypothetical protein [Clostridium sp. MD294]|uniref:hypothetical protein n=1 Tax=Clostridium sp. MD294 TaxID=97138 RepID=UPI0003AB47BF|nr:hypothetical protein [Clostridium sp. MD294]
MPVPASALFVSNIKAVFAAVGVCSALFIAFNTFVEITPVAPVAPVETFIYAKHFTLLL